MNEILSAEQIKEQVELALEDPVDQDYNAIGLISFLVHQIELRDARIKELEDIVDDPWHRTAVRPNY